VDDPETELEEPGGGALPDDDLLGAAEDTVMDGPPMADPPTAVDGAPYGARSEREILELVEQHLPMLGPIARRLMREVGWNADPDELLSAGREALFDAARIYDAARSPFAPFAATRARWKMIDAIRRDTRGRANQRRARALAALALLESGPLFDDEAPQDEDAQRQHLRRVLRAEASAAFVGLAAEPAEVEVAPDDPEEALMRARAKSALRTALDGLPERDRQILERHYFGGERFDAIAESLGVSKSWLSRIHTRAIEALGTALRDH
jgi:RNA polymerase sigma factor for flagellar operon FliA